MSQLQDYKIQYNTAPYTLAVSGNFAKVSFVRLSESSGLPYNSDTNVKFTFDDGGSIIRKVGDGLFRKYERVTVELVDSYGNSLPYAVEVGLVLGEGNLYSERVRDKSSTDTDSNSINIAAGGTATFIGDDQTSEVRICLEDVATKKVYVVLNAYRNPATATTHRIAMIGNAPERFNYTGTVQVYNPEATAVQVSVLRINRLDF